MLSADPGAEKPETYEYQRMIAAWMHARGLSSGLAVLAQGPSERYPRGNHRMELVDLGL